MTSWTRMTLVALGCAGGLLLVGCHSGAAVSAEKPPAQNEPQAKRPAGGAEAPGQHGAQPASTGQMTRQQEFEERQRALLAEVQAETPEETVRSLLYKTQWIISPFRSTFPRSDDLLADVNRNPRVQKLLRIAHEGTDAQRKALREAILKMVNVYLTELPDFTPEGVPWQPSVTNPGGGTAFVYLLDHLGLDPASTLKLLVDVHLREQAAIRHRSESQQRPGPQEQPERIVMTDQGLFLAVMAEQLLSTLGSRADLQKGLTQPQLDVLHRFDRQNETAKSTMHNPWQILKDATEFVYPLSNSGQDNGDKASTRPASRPERAAS